jgi:hypothetical protein
MFDRNAYMRNYYKTHKRDSAKLSTKRNKKIRAEIFALLGGRCSNPKCLVPNGCSDSRCLQIDHIHGGGNKRRKNNHSNNVYYKRILNEIKAGSKDYQLLCANCNWIKRYENNENRN